MTLVKWNPNQNLLSPNSWDHFLEDIFGDGWKKNSNSWSPSVDVSEDNNTYTITADLPGISKKDINMNVKENVLRISGERKNANDKKTSTYFRTERGFGTFNRSFHLPDNVNDKKITADFKNGVLTVIIPKSEEIKVKDIEIKVS